MNDKLIYYVCKYDGGGAGNVVAWTLEWIRNNLGSNIHKFNSMDDLFLKAFDWRDQDPDIIYIESNTLNQYRDIIKIHNIFKNAKIYFRMHDPIVSYSEFIYNKKIAVERFDYRTILRFKELTECGDKLTVIVGNKADLYSAKMLGLNAKYIPFTGIITKNFNLDSKKVKQLKIPLINNNILAVAAYYSKGKGAIELFKTIANSELHEFEWYIVGNVFNKENPEFNSDMKIPELNALINGVMIRDDVHIEGYQSDLSKYYKLCDRVFITSTVESYSLTAYEAHSYGDYVVCFDWYGLPWQNNHTMNIHITSMYRDDLADAAINMLRKPIINKSRSSYKDNLLRILFTIYDDKCNIIKDEVKENLYH